MRTTSCLVLASASVCCAAKTTTVTLTISDGASLAGGRVVVDPGGTLKEITRMNNRVGL